MYGWEQTELGAWKEADRVLFDGVIFTAKKEGMRVRGLEGEAGLNQSPWRRQEDRLGCRAMSGLTDFCLDQKAGVAQS